MTQDTIEGSAVGIHGMSLVPPNSADFSTFGTDDTIGRARAWALENRLFLYRGTTPGCVHGLYRMNACTFAACKTVGLDHTNIWVEHDARGAFILTHPYTTEIPLKLHVYAEMHGLTISSSPRDGWYGLGTSPIRLAVPSDWPLWPIERDAALIVHAQPVTWPQT